MTRTISVDSLNDIYIGPDGSLAIVTGLESILQACAQAAKTQLGEMQYATDQGIPNFDVVWSGHPNLVQFEAYLRRNLATVPDVVGINSVTVQVSGGVLSYVVEIQTIYGPGVLNG